MRPDIQKIVRPLWLRDYAPEYGDAALQVWVNPPKTLTDERVTHLSKSGALMAEVKAFAELSTVDGVAGAQSIEDARTRMQEIGREIVSLTEDMHKWTAEIWSQGAPETRMSAEELQAFVKECDESDPMLYSWLVERTLDMIQTYRTSKKKV